jgi:abortive infection bacteriophage resistance protein
MHYEKPPLLPEQHLVLLKERGLIIPDEQRVLNYLKNVGYYRLTGYMFHLQSNDGSHTFHDQISFDHIAHHYQFDTK